jgi:hypothetical protein
MQVEELAYKRHVQTKILLRPTPMLPIGRIVNAEVFR